MSGVWTSTIFGAAALVGISLSTASRGDWVSAVCALVLAGAWAIDVHLAGNQSH